MIVLFFVSAISFTISLLHLNGIETNLRIIILFLIYLYGFYFIWRTYHYIVNKNKIKYIIIIIINIIISCILLLTFYFIDIIYGEIGNMGESDKSIYTGYLITLKDTESIDSVGIINNKEDIEGYVIANEIIKDHKLQYDLEYYDTYEEIIDALYTNKITGAFVQGSYVSYFNKEEGYEKIASETKIVYKKSIERENEIVNNNNDKLLTEPFTILLMGVDSTLNGIDTNSAFNGDTLMMITFNPKTLNATIFSIPRDLYIPISCRKGNPAKINSSTVGGISCVIKTIKDLTDIDIDYYAKINFKGVVDLVEALKGIDVEVTYPFCEQDSNRNIFNQICLEKGFQHLNGEETLAYARHRHSLPTGDLQRIQNQQLIVEAIGKKLVSLNTVTDFREIISSISNNITTNLSRNQILSSYNILKDMVVNVISDRDALVIEKAYLEVYDMQVYNEGRGTYSSALGYYKDSLKDIIKSMKRNLEIEDKEIIKDFSFDANTPYELKVAGKGLKTGAENVGVIPNFIGKSVSEVEDWGNNNNITINKEYVTELDSYYNPEIAIGLVSYQNIKAGSSLNNIKSLTIYINTVNE